MFTGLVECKGEVIENTSIGAGHRLMIHSPYLALKLGESIAVNGVCLTLITTIDKRLAFDVSPETRHLTTLGELKVGDWVNLERAMPADGRFGGHFVSGHVDTTAVIEWIKSDGDYVEMAVHQFATSALKYLIPKGSITLDGVNLTINKMVNGSLHVMLVPQTLEATTLRFLQEGQRINVEFDYLTRIVAHQLEIIGVSA
jgi:riboflavin synthase